MKSWIRFGAAVLAGAFVWAVLWNLGTRVAQAAFPEMLRPGAPITDVAVLLGYIAFSVCLSVMAGYTTARVAGERPASAVWTLAALQLSLGLYFELTNWSLLPAWYHVVFLALIVPATVYGGSMPRRERRTPEMELRQRA